ncbi:MULTISPECIES: spore germination protein [Paenibacillus]|uniref:Spore germination protein n=1 Tax=Paenibacillus validus TaxID=44253 RepID=A0A7X3CV24_9BACL|nr:MULTISPECIES: spore germination protein [Paenibacillus]MUG73286.1 spore germination protein [Paenibacillus validus]
MPVIILSPIKVTNGEGTVTFGDVLQITPKTTSKAYSGSGGGIVGDFSRTFSILSLTNTLDSDVKDNTTARNN